MANNFQMLMLIRDKRVGEATFENCQVIKIQLKIFPIVSWMDAVAW